MGIYCILSSLQGVDGEIFLEHFREHVFFLMTDRKYVLPHMGYGKWFLLNQSNLSIHSQSCVPIEIRPTAFSTRIPNGKCHHSIHYTTLQKDGI